MDEDELSRILGLIQNCENRERFFGDSLSQSRAASQTTAVVDEDSMDTVDVFQPEPIDQKKWTEFLNEISKKMAESFLKD